MPSPGTCIGSYRLVRLLGEGGMGAVYEAEHTLIERRAAVKLLHSELLEQRSSVQRFLNEARAINRVRHPGLVEILELGELPDGAPYLVMELLIGETLSAHSARTRSWQPAMAIDIVRQIAEAMAAAHAHGIVHRDLKPSNLMLLTAELPEWPRVKVLDFGIAKLAPSAPSTKGSDPLTRSQALLGTAEYMAPEQCRDARGVDAKADVYALGVIFYELLAGQRPFTSAMPLEVMLQHLQTPPPFLKTHCPNLGGALLALVHQMLAKDPRDRPTMESVARQLASNLLAQPQQTRTADAPTTPTLEGVSLAPRTADSKVRRRLVLWTLLGLGSLAPFGIGSGVLLRHRQPPRKAAVAALSPSAPSLVQAPAPPPLARKAVNVAPAVAPPPIPPVAASSALPSPIKPAPPPNVQAARRPPTRPSAPATPPVFFKNKDPDGF